MNQNNNNNNTAYRQRQQQQPYQNRSQTVHRQYQQQNQDHGTGGDDTDKSKSQHRRTIDYFTPMGKYMIEKNVLNRRKRQPTGKIRPDMSYLTHLLPPNNEQPVVYDLATKFVHVSTNKSKHAIHAIKWTPDARRVLVSSHSGEFTLWNGLTFNFETIMQAHDAPIFTLEYSHNGEWLISGDKNGCIKFWQPNFNNVNILDRAHENAVQNLVFSPNDSKFVSCSDDQTLKIWNFVTAKEERTLKGHHWDVKCSDWHSSLGLIVSGSKDSLVKFWDPRDARCITTIHDFKQTITTAKFQKTGNERLLAATSRDKSTRIFDIRTMKTLNLIKSAGDYDISSNWHPIHSSVLTLGGYDGNLSTYDLSKDIQRDIVLNKERQPNPINNPLHKIPHAHDKAIHTIEYHPLGHILCTAGADKSMRFWCRARPNDTFGFKDSAYTGESWSEKQQSIAIKDMDYVSSATGAGISSGTAGNMSGDAKAAAKKDVPILPGFGTLPGFRIPGSIN